MSGAHPHPDRRDVLRKGLIAGGLAAAGTVVSSFNHPAGAFSSGTYRVQFTGSGNNTSFGQVYPPTTPGSNCTPPGWNGAVIPDSQVNVTISVDSVTSTATINFNSPDDNCSISGFRRQTGTGGGGNPPCDDARTLNTFSTAGMANNGNVYLVITCS